MPRVVYIQIKTLVRAPPSSLIRSELFSSSLHPILGCARVETSNYRWNWTAVEMGNQIFNYSAGDFGKNALRKSTEKTVRRAQHRERDERFSSNCKRHVMSEKNQNRKTRFAQLLRWTTLGNSKWRQIVSPDRKSAMCQHRWRDEKEKIVSNVGKIPSGDHSNRAVV